MSIFISKIPKRVLCESTPEIVVNERHDKHFRSIIFVFDLLVDGAKQNEKKKWNANHCCMGTLGHHMGNVCGIQWSTDYGDASDLILISV